MTPIVCLTVDVEDWYEGMEALGHPIPRPGDARAASRRCWGPRRPGCRDHLFTIGNYAATVRKELARPGGRRS